MSSMLSTMFNDYDFWVNFVSNMLAGVLLTLVFGLVITSVMSHFSERRKAKEQRRKFLEFIERELKRNTTSLTAALEELPKGNLPFPLFEVSAWKVSVNSSLLENMEVELIHPILSSYNRIWAAMDLYQNLLEAYFERLARPSEASEKRYLFFRKTLLDRLRDLQPKLGDSLQKIDTYLKAA
ncbi:MAG TPA: hypothetical protein VKF61_04720 [Candidatus Polarisedimenticolia bacterium]|nr:hypothetical protein [Candidatus Polarisedimenticolia bacterium]